MIYLLHAICLALFVHGLFWIAVELFANITGDSLIFKIAIKVAIFVSVSLPVLFWLKHFHII